MKRMTLTSRWSRVLAGSALLAAVGVALPIAPADAAPRGPAVIFYAEQSGPEGSRVVLLTLRGTTVRSGRAVSAWTPKVHAVPVSATRAGVVSVQIPVDPSSGSVYPIFFTRADTGAVSSVGRGSWAAVAPDGTTTAITTWPADTPTGTVPGQIVVRSLMGGPSRVVTRWPAGSSWWPQSDPAWSSDGAHLFWTEYGSGGARRLRDYDVRLRRVVTSPARLPRRLDVLAVWPRRDGSLLVGAGDALPAQSTRWMTVEPATGKVSWTGLITPHFGNDSQLLPDGRLLTSDRVCVVVTARCSRLSNTIDARWMTLAR